MRVRAVVSDAGLGSSENDDRAGAAQTDAGLYAWVIDGATNVAERDYLSASQNGAFLGDVPWYAQALSAALSAHAPENLAPRALHETASRDVSAAYAALLSRLPEPPPLCAQPMAALVLARIVGGWAELYELGDCAAFALAENGGVERLTAAEAQAGAVESGASIAARQGVVGFSPKAIWQDRLSALQREREGQLSRPTLRVSTPAAGAKFGGVESTRQLGDRAVLVLMSDGYERFAAKYGLGDEGAMIRRSVTEGPERILAEIRALETVDPECRRFARLNPSDDATCLVLAP